MSNSTKVIEGTVHSYHKEKLGYFENRKKDLPKKKKMLEKLEKTMEKELEDLNMSRVNALKEEIDLLVKDINNIENDFEENKYFLEAGPTIFQYYDYTNQAYNKDNGHEISKMLLSKRKTILPDSKEAKKTKPKFFKTMRKKENGTSMGNTICKKELLDQYRSSTDSNYVRKTNKLQLDDEAICSSCNVPKVLNYTDSKYICEQCGVETMTHIDTDRPSFRDPPPEASYFAYKRINHFNELLAQFQAKESTNIPKEVFEMIRKELKKERLDVEELDYDTCRRYLRKYSDLKYNHYYDHIFHIINRMNGRKPLNMTPEMEHNLRYLFLQIQDPFDKYCPDSRKNFIHYNFVFHKFCKILGYDQFLKYFPLLKSPEKLYLQEKIWEKIVTDVGLPHV